MTHRWLGIIVGLVAHLRHGFPNVIDFRLDVALSVGSKFTWRRCRSNGVRFDFDSSERSYGLTLDSTDKYYVSRRIIPNILHDRDGGGAVLQFYHAETL